MCASRLLAASPGNFSNFYLIKMKKPQLILAFFWPLKLIKTLFTYFNHKIMPKPSLDGTLSPNTISFSEGLYCTVLVSAFGTPTKRCEYFARLGTRTEDHSLTDQNKRRF